MISQEAIFFIEEAIKSKISKIDAIHNSGSNRQYFRIYSEKKTYIFTNSLNTQENKSFFYFSKNFYANDFLVPKVLAIHENKEWYLQEDIGNKALLDYVLENNYSDVAFDFYEKSLKELAKLQIFSKNKIDFEKCYDFKIFDEKVVWNDLFYFKNYFLDKLDIAYKKSTLIDEFQLIANKIKSFKMDYFLYRDFQARNIYIYNKKPYFIDFQGGMQGFIGYDLVSLLWQAKANLPNEWKEKLKNYYFDFFINANEMTLLELQKQYDLALVLRFYQLLGAYGLRGLVEKKSHFLESILYHLKNLEYLIKNNLVIEYPELHRITKFFVSDDGREFICKAL